MPPRTDFLTQQRRQIEARLEQLKPAHEEYFAKSSDVFLWQ